MAIENQKRETKADAHAQRTGEHTAVSPTRSLLLLTYLMDELYYSMVYRIKRRHNIYILKHKRKKP